MSCKCDTESSKKVCEPCVCDPCVCLTSAVVGERAPDFSTEALMPDGTFKTISLSQYLGKYLVLFFYPMDFTFVCPTEIIAFSDRCKEFQASNCEVLAASCDSVYSHLAWSKISRSLGGISKLDIPILADKSLEIAKKYGILIHKKGISLRGLFIIDGTGVLRQVTINDLPVGRSVDETLRLVQALQFTDEYGETCPINWKKGDKALNPSKSSEYFSATYH